LNNQIASTARLLNSLRISSERERIEIENLYNEKARIKNLVTHFKNNNEEYLKIKQGAEENVKSVLTDSKLLLKFAALSVIESLRSNSELYNFIIHDNSNNTTITYGSNYPSLMLSGSQQQQQSFSDAYTALIVADAEKLYNNLTIELTNRIMAVAAGSTAIRTSSLPTANNRQTELIHKTNAYQTE
jgi:hypothetical protein